MKNANITFLAQFASREMAADAAYVLRWIDDLVAAGIAQFDADEIPLLQLLSGEVFILGDSFITRLR